MGVLCGCDGGFFGIVVGVGLVSLIDEIVYVFTTEAEHTCGHDKMKHFLREEACFKRNHCVATRAAVTLFLGCGPVRKVWELVLGLRSVRKQCATLLVVLTGAEEVKNLVYGF